MNNSKENILKRIAAAGMPEYAYPDFGYEPQHFDDPAAMFAQRLRAAGGEAAFAYVAHFVYVCAVINKQEV